MHTLSPRISSSLGWILTCLLLTFAAASVSTVAAPSVASAQDKEVKSEEYGVTIAKPDGWEKAEGNEKALAIFTHSVTQSQIEVVPTKLMTADVSEVFFNTFYKTLQDSNFTRNEQKEETFGSIAGKLTKYSFNHSGVTLKVHVFSFVRDTTAWLVVGYWQDSEEKNVQPTFAQVIKDMQFSK